MKASSLVIALCCLTASSCSMAPTFAQGATSLPAQGAAVTYTAAPKPAQDVLASARELSTKEHKPTLVMFHASWCGWCKRLDAVMSRPEFKKMFEANYVLVTLDVLENGAKIAQLENPGGKEYMKELGGEKSGLPFYAWLDTNGKKIADSNVMPKESNIGYPGEPAEIQAFMALVKKTAPHWSAADQKKLNDYLVANAPKPAAGH